MTKEMRNGARYNTLRYGTSYGVLLMPCGQNLQGWLERPSQWKQCMLHGRLCLIEGAHLRKPGTTKCMSPDND